MAAVLTVVTGSIALALSFGESRSERVRLPAYSLGIRNPHLLAL